MKALHRMRLYRRLNWSVRLLTSNWRMLPSILIIGAQKAGTTSLCHYIVRHGQVLPGTRKEIRFFHAHYRESERWYRANFPLARACCQTIDASPGYLDHPYTPARVARLLAGSRIIVLLRDPVERAWSHYRHSCRLGAETLSFGDALELEEQRLAPVLELMDRDELYYPRELSYFSYKRRGRYAEHLARWFESLDRNQFLVIMSEDLSRRPKEVMEKVWAFLDLPPHLAEDFPHLRVGDGAELGAGQERSALQGEFERHDEELVRLLGLQLPWGNKGAQPDGTLAPPLNGGLTLW